MARKLIDLRSVCGLEIHVVKQRCQFGFSVLGWGRQPCSIILIPLAKLSPVSMTTCEALGLWARQNQVQ